LVKKIKYTLHPVCAVHTLHDARRIPEINPSPILYFIFLRRIHGGRSCPCCGALARRAWRHDILSSGDAGRPLDKGLNQSPSSDRAVTRAACRCHRENPSPLLAGLGSAALTTRRGTRHRSRWRQRRPPSRPRLWRTPPACSRPCTFGTRASPAPRSS